MVESHLIDFMFKIHNSTNAIGNYQMNKEVSKVPARELLKEKSLFHVAEKADGIKTASLEDTWWGKRIDTKEALKNAKVYRKDYERTAPETLNAATKNEMYIKAKQLKDEFTIGMLSREELHPVKQFTEEGTIKCVVDEERLRANDSVNREGKWEKNNREKIKQFKNIMRHLNPDDPNAGDVEKYRPRLKGIR